MQFNPRTNVTLFLSVRKGLENCLLQEIKQNRLLNNINRIHKKRDYPLDGEVADTPILPGPESYLSSVQLAQEPSHTDDKWITLRPGDQKSEDSSHKSAVSKGNPHPASAHSREACDIYVQPGGLEVKCNFDWLLKSSLFVKSAESVWLRIGNPFRCHSSDQLVTFISRLPWSSYLSPSKVDSIPLRIISRNSKLWSSHTIEECVREGIKQSFGKDVAEDNKSISANDNCISLTLSRNTCYTALQFTGRLSPRLYNFKFFDGSEVDYSKYLPSWSLSGIRKSLSDQGRPFEGTGASEENPDDSFDSKRNKYITLQNLLSNDFSDTSDSLVAAFLQDREVIKTLDSGVETVWDPFCGNGLVVCELMSLLLSLPNYVLDTSIPVNSFFTKNLHEYRSRLQEYTSSRGPARFLNIVASDTSLVKLTEANSKILRFYSYYKDLLGHKEFPKQNPYKEETFFKSYGFFPLTVHNCSLEKLSHYMNNALILTKIPYVDLKNKNKFETIKTYKQFGQVVSSKTDWKGVFAISRGRCFEYFSGLEWKTLLKSTNSKSEIKLLKWTGRTRHFRSVEEKLDQLNETDF